MTYRSLNSEIRSVLTEKTKKDYTATIQPSEPDSETEVGPDPVDNDTPDNHPRTAEQPRNHKEVEVKYGNDLVKHNLVRSIRTQIKQKHIDAD
jgi:hypothetical protein